MTSQAAWQDSEEIPDAELMVRIAQGDPHAFRTLASRHMPRAYAIARRVLVSPQDAEEAVQDAFTSLWRHAAAYNPERAALTTWLYRIVTNACLDRARKIPAGSVDIAAIEHALADSGADAEAALMERQQAEYVRCAVQALPPKQRMAVTLCYYESFTNAQAATVLGVHVKTVEGLLSRARKTLQRTLVMPESGQ